MLRYFTTGESHGEALVAVLSGLPAGLRIQQKDLDLDLWRRQQGYGRGGRMKIERDSAHILSGVRHGMTIGSPISIVIENRDWKNWQESLPVEDGDPQKHIRPRIYGARSHRRISKVVSSRVADRGSQPRSCRGQCVSS